MEAGNNEIVYVHFHDPAYLSDILGTVILIFEQCVITFILAFRNLKERSLCSGLSDRHRVLL